eukprot:TRINITY_DN24_c0_g1_i1.p1 TRINITY_DN24_c0_g1~~TRINITY_DN24_c0_g1_i1.p1  ORF type:complete len:369 (-),score=95.72 TRINITY_DN24_c0_g1_i1:266-1372(-)
MPPSKLETSQQQQPVPPIETPSTTTVKPSRSKKTRPAASSSSIKDTVLLASWVVIFAALAYHLFATITAPETPLDEAIKLYADSESKFIDVKVENHLFSVHYKIEGNPNGKTLVLVHGSTPSLSSWDDITAQLKSEFRIVRLDLAGYGLTNNVLRFNHTQFNYAKFFDAFMTATKLKETKVTLVGHSFGGAVAWIYAGFNPDNVESLILIDSSGPYARDSDFPVAFVIFHKSAGLFFRYYSPSWLMRLTLKYMYFDKSKITEDLVNRYHNLWMIEGTREAITNMCENYVFSRATLGIYRKQVLREIKAPALILWGEQDTIIPLRYAQQLHEDLKNSKLVVYKDQNHMAHEENPARVANDIRDFLKTLP